MKILDLQQGSEEWHRVRATRLTASEAPAMMGVSKYQSRNDLLKQKATGLTPDVDAHTQRLFDSGHATEAKARPIAESILNDDLYPVTCEDDDGRLLASMDGLTMLEDVGFEHKLYSESLAAQVKAGELEPHYTIQMDQQMLVSGAEKILFMCSDGTEENCEYLWYERDESKFKPLLAGWAQFEKDLAEYEAPEVEQPKATGTSPDALPALTIQATGMVTASNLDEFRAHAKAVLSEINTDLQTDEQFATAEKTVKWCKETEKRLATAKESLLSQTSSIYDALNTIDSVNGDVREMRLMLDKAVKQQKEARKLEILKSSNEAYAKHVTDIEYALTNEGGNWQVRLNVPNPDFSGAMKGLKTMTSIQSACDDELARAKIKAHEAAETVRANILQLKENAFDYKFLFNDFGQICQKPAEDFAAIVKSRIADHKEAEQKKLDAERERIRKEEEAKAKKAAEENSQQETAKKPAQGKKPAYEMPPLDSAGSKPAKKGIQYQILEYLQANSSVSDEDGMLITGMILNNEIPGIEVRELREAAA